MSFEICGNVLVQKDEKIVKYFNTLLPEEKIFIYYMQQACQAGERIALSQMHRHNEKIMDILSFLLFSDAAASVDFRKDVETYFKWLKINNGVYFVGEDRNNKYTPSRLGLVHLTFENVLQQLVKANYPFLEDLNEVYETWFNDNVDSTSTIEGSIEGSGVNFYSKNFTEEHFQKLTPSQQTKINAYFSVDKKTGQPAVTTYSYDQLYATELTLICHWLDLILAHIRRYPASFDIYFVKSI